MIRDNYNYYIYYCVCSLAGRVLWDSLREAPPGSFSFVEKQTLLMKCMGYNINETIAYSDYLMPAD